MVAGVVALPTQPAQALVIQAVECAQRACAVTCQKRFGKVQDADGGSRELGVPRAGFDATVQCVSGSSS
jgi:hypothetical protein